MHTRYTPIQAVTESDDTSIAVPAKSLESCAYYCHHSECCIAFRFYEMHERGCLTLSSPPWETSFSFRQESLTYLEEGDFDVDILCACSLIMCCRNMFVHMNKCMMPEWRKVCVNRDLFNIDVKSAHTQNP